MELSKITRYFILYSLVSVVSLAWSIYDSLRITTNFLSLTSELTDGYKLSIIVNFLFFIFLVIGKFFQLLIFGELRIIESEHIFEKLPLLVINLLLIVSNDDNIIFNCFLLHSTILSKVFHIILIDRVDYTQMKIWNRPNDENFTVFSVLKSYTSIFGLVGASIVVNFLIAKFLAYDVFQGVNSVVCLLIGFQFAIQGVESLTYFAKLILNVYELIEFRVFVESLGIDLEDDDMDDDDSERVWENKPYYTKVIDIISSSLKLISYVSFIYLLTFNSTSLPLSMLQGTFSSIKLIYTEVKQLISFIESTKRLDSQLKNATADDLAESDNLCIICREDMFSIDEYEATHNKQLPLRKYPKKLRCKHILHMGCLKDWLERSENCPLCRRNVFTSGPVQEEPEASQQDNAPPPQQQDLIQEPQPQPALQPQGASQDYQEIFEDLNIPAGAPTSVGVSSSASPLSSVSLNNFTINLPRGAFIPPDWAVLPLSKRSANFYNVHLSRSESAALRITDEPADTTP